MSPAVGRLEIYPFSFQFSFYFSKVEARAAAQVVVVVAVVKGEEEEEGEGEEEEEDRDMYGQMIMPSGPSVYIEFFDERWQSPYTEYLASSTGVSQTKWESMLATLNENTAEKIQALQSFKWYFVAYGVGSMMLGPALFLTTGGVGPGGVAALGGLTMGGILYLGFRSSLLYTGLMEALNSVFQQWGNEGITGVYDYFNTKQTGRHRIVVAFPSAAQPAAPQPVASQPAAPQPVAFQPANAQTAQVSPMPPDQTEVHIIKQTPIDSDSESNTDQYEGTILHTSSPDAVRRGGVSYCIIS